ncbi:MAG: hypothetical protein J7J76_02130 [Candidatus Latescibacteria bacterium]|nr:hypothetical protein [Candidatus Latescibacterota bacterium]
MVSDPAKRKQTAGLRNYHLLYAPEMGMTLIVKTVTRWVKGFIFLFGLYIILYGHLTPGGGFAGGVITAGAFILLTLAFGKEVALRKMSKTAASEFDSLGALMFLLLAWLGLCFGGPFFLNFLQRKLPGQAFHLFSAGNIPLCNIAIGVKVGASLFMVFIILSVLRVVTQKGERRMVQTARRDR